MATTPLTLISERWLDQVVLAGTAADQGDADFGEFFTLPAGFGDCALVELYVEVVNSVGVPAVAIPWLGARAGIFGGDEATFVDIIGVQPWYRTTTATAVACYFSPDPLVLWRQAERLHIKSPDLDTSTTADVFVSAKVVRVRPIEGPPAPLQLVR